ncbi:diguanylate cyclase [Thiocystis violacea]|uniref:GGDEF domain-containing protein n=1 Tax=Thiocystis violacea TaxID=13725 RepID=UPI0019078E56|nr:diguanylate cyclase [Thiocystis violacea]MBK1719105.1 GGDEF domain-containing protein [Thiocystis violacea]
MKRLFSHPTDPLAQRIRALKVEHAYRQLPTSLLVNTINGLILVLLLWGSIDVERLLGWLLLLYAVTLVRLWWLRRYLATNDQTTPAVIAWRILFAVGALASGLTWGSAALLLFHPDSLNHQIFLAFALGGMVAGALPLLSALPPAFPLFAIPVSLPILVQLFLQGERLPVTMAILFLIFTVAMLVSSTQFSRIFRESVELRLRLKSSIEEKRQQALLARLDTLTGIANRRHFDEALESEWKRGARMHTPLAMIIADVDYFKRYNDHLGHVAGDSCLTRVAQTMATAARRPGDLVARIGGEEFAFLLPNTSLRDAALIAERVREDLLEERIPHPASPVADRITLSLGVASLIPDDGATKSDLVKAADAALYRAKQAGRDRFAMMT